MIRGASGSKRAEEAERRQYTGGTPTILIDGASRQHVDRVYIHSGDSLVILPLSRHARATIGSR